MKENEKEFLRQQIADFRYSVIAELCNPYIAREEKLRLLKEKSSRNYDIPGSEKNSISTATIKTWMKKYNEFGKDGLFPKVRSDNGRQKAFSDSEASALIELLEKKPALTAATAVKILKKEGKIQSEVSSSSLSRFLEANNMRRPQRIKSLNDQKQCRFQFEHPLECVQADAMHGFPVPDGKGKMRKTILIAFIDDFSRRIVYGQFDFSEKSILFEQGIKHILKAHGKIGKLYVDNGSTFVSNQTNRILDSLQIHLVHSKPYRPQGRGKIERFFRTVRECFLPMVEPSEIKSLDQLNQLFRTWLEMEYHRSVHSAIKQTPIEKWLSSTSTIKYLDKNVDLDRAFLHTLRRKVYKDSIVCLKGAAFEVPSILIGKSIDIFYDPTPPINRITIKSDGKNYGEARPVDLYGNTKVSRNITGERELLTETEKQIGRTLV